MITIGEDDVVAQGVDFAVAERRPRLRFTEGGQDGAMGDGTEGKNDFQRFEGSDLFPQKPIARADFHAYRSIFRRHTANGVGYPTPDQRQIIIAFRAVRTFRKSSISQGSIQKVAGEVTCKRATGAVGAPEARGKPDNQKSSVIVSE